MSRADQSQRRREDQRAVLRRKNPRRSANRQKSAELLLPQKKLWDSKINAVSSPMLKSLHTFFNMSALKAVFTKSAVISKSSMNARNKNKMEKIV